VIRNGVRHATSTVSPALLVIAKAPVPGKVKTRLCPPCTPAEAAELARAALQDTLDAALAARRPGRRVLVLDGEPGDWLPDGFDVIPQRGDGLAERLAAAFADAGEPALLVGMDTPQLTPARLDALATGLHEHGAVLGPAEDGGWWVLALRDPAHAEALRDLPMSTVDTGTLTVEALRGRGLRVGYAERLRDVDTALDAWEVARRCPDGEFAAAVHRNVPAAVAR
jgi:rSAM/selenodomain-associated transferase 1